MIVAQQSAPAAGRAANRAGEHDIRVVWVYGNIAAFRAANRIAVPPQDRAFIGAARHRNRAVVLLRTIDLIRKPIIRRHVIKLSGGLIVNRHRARR